MSVFGRIKDLWPGKSTVTTEQPKEITVSASEIFDTFRRITELQDASESTNPLKTALVCVRQWIAGAGYDATDSDYGKFSTSFNSFIDGIPDHFSSMDDTVTFSESLLQDIDESLGVVDRIVTHMSRTSCAVESTADEDGIPYIDTERGLQPYFEQADQFVFLPTQATSKANDEVRVNLEMFVQSMYKLLNSHNIQPRPQEQAPCAPYQNGQATAGTYNDWLL